ncbi:AMP-binding protein [Kitasatospora sp. NPDC051170]|uniref:AMP-binding protein n=1 Tax=Kitasatospora sp. NPDC051170 TaxID=3364056 RepID=UPI0037A1F842
MGNLATELTAAAVRYPFHPVFRSGREVLSFVDLDEFGGRVAGGLYARGVRAGSRVVLRLTGGPALPVLFYGALRIGAVVSVPEAGASGGRAGHLVLSSVPGIVFAGPGTAGAAGPPAVPVGADFLDQLLFWPQLAHSVPRGDDDPAVSSRRTRAGIGTPRVLTHGGLRARATAVPGLGPGRVLPVPPAGDDPHGFLTALHACVLAGACLSERTVDGPAPGNR